MHGYHEVGSINPIVGHLLRFLAILIAFLPLVCGVVMFLSLEKAKGQQLPKVEKSQRHEIVVNYFYNFPAEVKKVFSESMVSVRVSVRTFFGGIPEDKANISTGFVVDDEGFVLVALHGFGEIPSAWFNTLTKVSVYDGKNHFESSLIAINPGADLALIKVEELGDPELKFGKKAVVMADNKENLPDHFYAARFMPFGPGLYLPVRLGQYLLETNVAGANLLSVMMGAVNGTVEGGFSGSPLIGPDGKVYGVVVRRGEAFTYVVPMGPTKDLISNGIKTFKGVMEPQSP